MNSKTFYIENDFNLIRTTIMMGIQVCYHALWADKMFWGHLGVVVFGIKSHSRYKYLKM